MSRKRIWAATMVGAAAIAVAGCGSDDSTSDVTTAADTVTTTATDASAETTSTTVSEDTGAVETTINTWILEGDCTLMTDKFLEAQTFDDNPKSACKTFESLFTAPSYGEDAIEITDVKFENDKASAVVGGSSGGVSVTAGGEEITSTYRLVYEDGTWKIDSVDVN